MVQILNFALPSCHFVGGLQGREPGCAPELGTNTGEMEDPGARPSHHILTASGSPINSHNKRSARLVVQGCCVETGSTRRRINATTTPMAGTWCATDHPGFPEPVVFTGRHPTQTQVLPCFPSKFIWTPAHTSPGQKELEEEPRARDVELCVSYRTMSCAASKSDI